MDGLFFGIIQPGGCKIGSRCPIIHPKMIIKVDFHNGISIYIVFLKDLNITIFANVDCFDCIGLNVLGCRVVKQPFFLKVPCC
jgi:hypothetical protein